MLTMSLGTKPTRELVRLQRATRAALSQAGAKQNWKRWEEALSLLAAVDEELEHRAQQLAAHPTLF